MKLSIKPGGMPSVINLPASKSYANRALILASLKPGLVTLKNLPLASDVTFLIKALTAIGLDVTNESEATIANHFPTCEGQDHLEIEVGEGGTTARFLASMLVTGKRPYTLILGQRLKDRPWSTFVDLVNKLGGKASLIHNKLNLQGPINCPEKLEVDCSETTQFASGLQLALAYQTCEVLPVKMDSSISYWNMTNVMIDHIKLNPSFIIPLDWSSASYPLAFGALKQEIFFPGLFLDSNQADGKFYSILKSCGAIEEQPGGIKVKRITHSKNFNLDVSDSLDLVPTLAFLFAHVTGTHILKGVGNLIHKESNRLEEVMKLLTKVGIKTWSESDELRIEGNNNLKAPVLDLALVDDHRMVMIGALFLRYHQGGSLSPAEAVNKSYPGFYELIK